MKSVFERIEECNSSRPENLRAIKYALMVQNPFRFYRGACPVFYEDYQKYVIASDNTRTWICGDLHLENFGSYKGDNRLVYFDLNDFDEAILAPATYELARILVSILLAADEFEMDTKGANELCTHFLTVYFGALSAGKATDIEKETATGVMKKYFRQVEKRKQKDLLARIAEKNGDGWVFQKNNRRILPIDVKKKKEVIAAVNAWLKQHHSEFLLISNGVDAGFRVAGTGSIGVERYAVLTLNPEYPGKSYILDLKEAAPSCLTPYVKVEQPKWKNEADRVASIQHRMQFVSPALLTPFELGGKYFVLKELQPEIDKMDFSLTTSKPKKIKAIIRSMAQLTAFAQLRSSGRQGSSIADELIAFGQRKDLQPALLKFAKEYYKVTNNYFTEFKRDYDKKLNKKVQA